MYGMNTMNPYPYGYPTPSPMFGAQMGQQGAFNPMPQSAPGMSQGGMEIIPVQTIQQVEQVQVNPGQRKMILVQNEPVVAARSADNMGLVTTEYYHLEKFIPGTQAPMQMDNYVTRQEFNAFVESLKTPEQKEASK